MAFYWPHWSRGWSHMHTSTHSLTHTQHQQTPPSHGIKFIRCLMEISAIRYPLWRTQAVVETYSGSQRCQDHQERLVICFLAAHTCPCAPRKSKDVFCTPNYSFTLLWITPPSTFNAYLITRLRWKRLFALDISVLCLPVAGSTQVPLSVCVAWLRLETGGT